MIRARRARVVTPPAGPPPAPVAPPALPGAASAIPDRPRGAAGHPDASPAGRSRRAFTPTERPPSCRRFPTTRRPSSPRAIRPSRCPARRSRSRDRARQPPPAPAAFTGREAAARAATTRRRRRRSPRSTLVEGGRPASRPQGSRPGRRTVLAAVSADAEPAVHGAAEAVLAQAAHGPEARVRADRPCGARP